MFQTSINLSPDLNAEERAQAIRDAYNQDRSQMTLMLAHQLKIQEVEILRALQGDTAYELDSTRWEEIIRDFEPLGDLAVIVSNGATTIEVTGKFGKFFNKDGFLNIRTDSLDMHIRGWELASVFAFKKPSHLDKHDALSIQFYDRRGNSAFKVFFNFGNSDPTSELIENYNQFIQKFGK